MRRGPAAAGPATILGICRNTLKCRRVWNNRHQMRAFDNPLIIRCLTLRKWIDIARTAVTREHIRTYVNDFTLDYGLQGKLAIEKLYQMAFDEGLIKKIPVLDFVV